MAQILVAPKGQSKEFRKSGKPIEWDLNGLHFKVTGTVENHKLSVTLPADVTLVLRSKMKVLVPHFETERTLFREGYAEEEKGGKVYWFRLMEDGQVAFGIKEEAYNLIIQ